MKAKVLLGALLLAALPPAAAHGDDKETTYDPLALDAALFATADPALSEDAPAAGEAWFPAGEANKPQPPLDFAWPVPGALLLGGEAVVTLAASAEKPMVTRDKDGDSFELALLRNGEPVPGASVRVGSADPAGSAAIQRTAFLHEAKLKVDGLALAKGDRLALRVQPLMPLVPDKGLKALVGGDAGTRVLFPSVRVPGVRDLGLQDAPLDEFLLSAAPPFRSDASVAYYALRVGHDRIELDAAEPANGRKAFLVLQGVEGPEPAHRHHETLDPARRAGAAHHVEVGGLLVRVHPGVGVKVPLAPGPDGRAVALRCVLNCPEGGFARDLPLADPSDPTGGGATGGTLIPPPRSTKGIPVSADAPAEEEKNLLPAPGAALALLAAGSALVHRRRGGKP